MRTTFFTGLFCLLLAATVSAQNKDYLISTDGLGAIKLGMSQSELEKITGKKINLTNPTDTISGSWMDSATVRYKNIDVSLEFLRSYYAKDSFRMIINTIKASSPLCKTTNGIGVGSDKLKIISAYDGYYMQIAPVYIDDDRKKKSKTESFISVRLDEEGDTITFVLRNKKVIYFEIYPVYDDEE